MFFSWTKIFFCIVPLSVSPSFNKRIFWRVSSLPPVGKLPLNVPLPQSAQFMCVFDRYLMNTCCGLAMTRHWGSRFLWTGIHLRDWWPGQVLLGIVRLYHWTLGPSSFLAHQLLPAQWHCSLVPCPSWVPGPLPVWNELPSWCLVGFTSTHHL